MTENDKLAEQLSALAHATRVGVFKALMAAGPEGVRAGVLADRLDVAPSLLSSHLSVLTRAGLIAVRRDGRHLIYYPRIEVIGGMITALVRDCCKGHPEICAPLDKTGDVCATVDADGQF